MSYNQLKLTNCSKVFLGCGTKSKRLLQSSPVRVEKLSPAEFANH